MHRNYPCPSCREDRVHHAIVPPRLPLLRGAAHHGRLQRLCAVPSRLAPPSDGSTRYAGTLVPLAARILSRFESIFKLYDYSADSNTKVQATPSGIFMVLAVL